MCVLTVGMSAASGCGGGNCGGDNGGSSATATGTGVGMGGEGGDASAVGVGVGMGGQGGDATAIGTGGDATAVAAGFGGNANSQSGATAGAFIDQSSHTTQYITNNPGNPGNPGNGNVVNPADVFTIKEHGVLVKSQFERCSRIAYVRFAAFVPEDNGTLAIAITNTGDVGIDTGHWVLMNTKGKVVFRVPTGVKMPGGRQSGVYVMRYIPVSADGDNYFLYDSEDIATAGLIDFQWVSGKVAKVRQFGGEFAKDDMTVEELMEMQNWGLSRALPWAIDVGPKF